MVNGLTLGSIYALIALGYTMVYGILLMINFAHSEIFMVGAYAGLAFLRCPWASALPGALLMAGSFLSAALAAGVLNLAIERMAYRPLRGASRLVPLISAIGVSLILQNLVMMAVTSESLSFPTTLVIREFSFGKVRLSTLQILILISSLVLMILLQLFISRTRWGKAMRATSQDRETAGLMGIDTHRVIALTFFIGGVLGGAAGVLNGLYYGSVKYNMGFLPGIKAFTAAVLGGIGNIPGAMLGGYLLGILEALGAGFIPGGAEWKDVFAFVVLILVLLVRPSGLLGEHVPEKI